MQHPPSGNGPMGGHAGRGKACEELCPFFFLAGQTLAGKVKEVADCPGDRVLPAYGARESALSAMSIYIGAILE